VTDDKRTKLARLLGLPALALAMASLFVTVVLSFLAINERSAIVAQSIREDALWASYQLDREAVRLMSELNTARLSATAAANGSLTTRFDILYSRIGMLTQGHYAEKFGATGALAEQVDTVRQAIMEMAPIFDEVARSGELPEGVAADLSARIIALRERTESLLIATNTRKADLQIAERERTQRSYMASRNHPLPARPAAVEPAIRRGCAPRRSRQPREVVLPGGHEPRDPHAAERHRRNG